MAPGRTPDSHKEQQWRRWLAQWQTSGLGITAFCARHDLSPASFYAWRRTLRRRDAHATAFAAVNVPADDTPPPAALEVLLDGGHVVRVRPGFDAATLRQLLAVLRQGRPC
jgi:hypothetical protein